MTALSDSGKSVRERAGARAGRADEAGLAIELLIPLVENHPRSAPLWYALGKAYFAGELYALAAAAFDSAAAISFAPEAESASPRAEDRNDTTGGEPGRQTALLGLDSLRREAAFRGGRKPGWAGEKATASASPPERNAQGLEAAEPSPGSPPPTPAEKRALMGQYLVAWGASRREFFRHYPKEAYQRLAGGDLLRRFELDGLQHEYLAAFDTTGLWGVRAFVSDTGSRRSDLFGRLLRLVTKSSGEGRPTGAADCPDYGTFRGAVWETVDTFAMMGAFAGTENIVRMARISRDRLPGDRRLCSLVNLLGSEFWEK